MDTDGEMAAGRDKKAERKREREGKAGREEQWMKGGLHIKSR